MHFFYPLSIQDAEISLESFLICSVLTFEVPGFFKTPDHYCYDVDAISVIGSIPVELFFVPPMRITATFILTILVMSSVLITFFLV